MKPDIIAITGAPGSGKTSLARLLDERLYGYVHIDPDDILQSVWEHNISNADYNREKVGVPLVKKTLLSLLDSEIRLIVDGHIDPEFMKQLNSRFRLLNVHCVAEDTAERFYRRELLSDGSEPDWLGDHMQEVKKLEQLLKKPILAGQKTILVKCNSGYDPSLDFIIEEFNL